MAMDAPDPKTFESWQEAFQYPVATVRSMERQLRNDIDSNRERLRTLVGASYRDLIGTAESIIVMDGQMQRVDSYLGAMGKQCNTRLLEKKGSNLRAWTGHIEATDRDHYAFASHFAVLRGCPEIISRLLRKSSSVLLAAKVLIISRLLHKKLLQCSKPPPYLESLRNRLVVMRRRLLNRIDQRFQNLEMSGDDLVEAMCAFSFATSSSPTDVLRHFHHVRKEAILEHSRNVSRDREGTLRALGLYVKTLKDTRALVPGQLARSLDRLKSIPLFRSPDLYHLLELNLDVHERWIDDDIKSFTPYIRQDDLSNHGAQKMLNEWAKQTFMAFLGELSSRLADLNDPKDIIQLRRQTLELWLSNRKHFTGIGSEEALNGLRDAFSSQCARLIHMRAGSLDRIGSIIEATLRDWQGGTSDLTPHLWGSSIVSMETSNGGKAFTEALGARTYGSSHAVQVIIAEYTSWLRRIEAIELMIQKLQETRWVDEVDDIEDENDLLDNIQILLSEEDPCALRKELASSLEEAFNIMEHSFEIPALDADEKENGQKGVYLLRLWREIRQHLPTSYHNSNIGSESILKLQESVANAALKTPIENAAERLLTSLRSSKVAGRLLWEGDPEMPVLPSPWAFRFLHELLSSMTGFGIDVWSTQAKNTLKRQMRNRLPRRLEKPPERVTTINGNSNDEGNDESNEGAEESTEIHGTSLNGITPVWTPINTSRDGQIQRLFDLLYLTNAAATTDSPNDNDHLEKARETLEMDVSLPEESLGRMRRQAAEYWKRTSLLFALLA